MTSGNDLLRGLGGISAGGLAPGATSAGAAASSSLDFQAMLEQARKGALESGLPVHLASNASVNVSEEQLARLGPVIDRLHAGGASHALVAIDGRFLVVDVMTRQVRAEFDPSSGEVLENIDAVASAPPKPDAGSAVPLPGVGVLPPSLAAALNRDEAA